MAGALKIIPLMESEGLKPDIIVFSTLIQGCIEKGLYNEAWNAFDRCRILYAQPDIVTYNQMIYLCALEDKPEKAMNLFNELDQVDIRPNIRIYASLLYCFSRSYTYEAASFLYYDKMVRNDIHPNNYILNIMMHACTVRGDITRAEHYLKEFRKFNLTPDSRTYSELLNTYAKSCLNGCLPPNLEVDQLTRYDANFHKELPPHMKLLLKSSIEPIHIEEREKMLKSIF